MILDSQVHVWHRVIPGRKPQRTRPFGHDELLVAMNAAGVDRAILVPPTWSQDGNDVALRAATENPARFAVMGTIPLEASRQAEVAAWKSQAGMLGLRIVFNTPALAERLASSSLEWLWTAAEEGGVPIMVHAAGLLNHVGRIAREHPGLRLVVDHLGLPSNARGDAIEPHVTELLSLATLENVAVKASALPAYSMNPFPFTDMHQSVCKVIEAFGAERVFWGSDLSRLKCSYSEVLTLMSDVIPCLSARQRSLIMGESLYAWIGWPEMRPLRLQLGQFES